VGFGRGVEREQKDSRKEIELERHGRSPVRWVGGARQSVGTTLLNLFTPDIFYSRPEIRFPTGSPAVGSTGERRRRAIMEPNTVSSQRI
jgi:hypothetical protein